MARKAYGTTIWGAELLEVLEQKTDSGRLGRGRKYGSGDESKLLRKKSLKYQT